LTKIGHFGDRPYDSQSIIYYDTNETKPTQQKPTFVNKPKDTITHNKHL